MMIVVRPAHRLGERRADPRLGRRVDGGGRVVEDQDPRVDHERAGDREPLALAARERDAALADHGVVALGQRLDELVRLGGSRRLARLLVASRRGRRRRCSRGRVAENRNGSCEIDADRAPQRRAACSSRTSTPSTSTRPVADVVEARHERRERRLARAGVADQRDRRSRPGRRGRCRASTGRPVGVGERDALEAQLARAAAAARARRARSRDVLRLVHHLEDPLAGRRRPLRLADPHPERCAAARPASRGRG